MPIFLTRIRTLAAAAALGVVAPAALADSSSAFSASSTSVGSSSASIEKSSDSSSAKGKVAQGNYTIVDMTAVAMQPDMLRLHLLATPGANFFLLLPRQTVEREQLATGQVISAQQRAYGLAFAAATASGDLKPFFLVLDDHWYRELESRPLVL